MKWFRDVLEYPPINNRGNGISWVYENVEAVEDLSLTSASVNVPGMSPL